MGSDLYHNGALLLGANLGFYWAFVARGATPEPPKPALRFDPGTQDMYDFFLRTPVPLARMNADLFGGKAAYWQEIVDHTTYDEFWKKRSLSRFMDGVKCAVLNVGGWFDAEDPVGPLKIYRAVEEKDPGIANMLVMGPWSHGGWSRGTGVSLGNLNFGIRTSEYFRENIQFPFFMQYLKDKPASMPEAWMFLTGVNEFRRLDAWPPKNLQPTTLYFDVNGGLSRTSPAPANQPVRADAVKMGGYQQLVRGEPFRGKYRKSFEKPEPFVAGEPAVITYELPDIYHAFRKGHRVMVQVQSSWFPLIDRNPQVFMEIPTAKPSDFKKATQRVYRSGAMASSITVMVQ